MRCVWMPGNMSKRASRHRKIEKSGHRVAAKVIPFPRWGHGGMISASLEAIWGMSAQSLSFVSAAIKIARQSTRAMADAVECMGRDPETRR